MTLTEEQKKGIFEVSKEDLKIGDEDNLDKRARRLYFLKINSNMMPSGFPESTFDFFSESSNSFINGDYRASMFLNILGLDSLYRHYLINNSADKNEAFSILGKSQMGESLKYHKKYFNITSSPDKEIYELFVKINELRNIVVVHPKMIDVRSINDLLYRQELSSEIRAFVRIYLKILDEPYEKENIDSFLEPSMIRSYDAAPPEGKLVDEVSLKDLVENNFSIDGRYYEPTGFGESVKKDIVGKACVELIKIKFKIIGLMRDRK